jgi:adenosylmethionine-8-amino-7-oxononanoate aminotransferase
LNSEQALGCVPAVPGYLAAMKDVCNEFGVLMILDEVMCGIGRTGYLHAWQEQGVVPDIQLIGKGLAGGFQPISCMLIGHRIAEGLEKGPSNGAFIHGHTFQNHTVGAAAAQKVIDMLQRQDSKGRTLLDNVKDQGNRLEQGLRDRLSDHRYVGDIRGVGLFWGVSLLPLAWVYPNLTYSD